MVKKRVRSYRTREGKSVPSYSRNDRGSGRGVKRIVIPSHPAFINSFGVRIPKPLGLVRTKKLRFG